MFSKSRHFTVNAGVCNNVNGSMYNYTTIVGDSERDGLEGRDYEPDEIELIPRRDIKLRQEIGSGPGYLLHSGTKRGRAVIVKVFNTHPNARERLEATLAMSKMLMHSNVLQVEGISIPSSMHHFIAYENVHWKNADGPLAYALKEDGDRSLRLAFTMVAQFAAALSYLDVHGFTVANMNVQNFDVLLDLDDRFVLSVNPESTSTDIVSDEHSANGTAWDVFNALCAKVLRSANHVIYAQEIEREPVAFEKLASATSVPGQKLSPPPAESGSTPDADQSSIPDSTTRREYVWRDIDQGTNSLSDVASRMSVDLGFELVPVNRLTWADTKSPHRCPGYVREEITVATSKAASAIVSRDAPGPLEICPICQEVVSDHEEFLCVCGDPDPGARPTIKCITCKNWSHANCVGNPKRFTCQACMMADTSSLRRGVRTDTDNFMNNTESMMIANGLKVLGGGHGGGGGEGKKGPGGAGGNGLGPRLAPKYLKDWDVNIVGGFGGLGGRGDEGGVGGEGEPPDIVAKPLYTREAGEVDEALMDMPLKDFGTKYKLSKDILDRLRKLEFTTAGALFEIEDGQLEEHGFNLGHISELKRACKRAATAK